MIYRKLYAVLLRAVYQAIRLLERGEADKAELVLLRARICTEDVVRGIEDEDEFETWRDG